MNKPALEKLLDQYINGKCIEQEIKLIEDFFYSYKKGDHLQEFSEETLDHFKLKMYGRIKNKVDSIENNPKKPFFMRPVQFVAFILLFIGFVSVTYLGYQQFWNQNEVTWVTKQAYDGQKVTIMLSDGTLVLLNSGSTIKYPKKFIANERTITLTGEAYFEVAKDVKRPFRITSGELATTVLGTSFNIRAYTNEEAEVTVATGKVSVTKRQTEVILTSGQQAFYNASNKDITKRSVDIEQFFAWKENTIHFDDMTLEKAIGTLERWYNVQITFENPQLRFCTISGKYKNENLINILESIRFVKNINYKFDEDNEIVLYGQTCEI